MECVYYSRSYLCNNTNKSERERDREEEPERIIVQLSRITFYFSSENIAY